MSEYKGIDISHWNKVLSWKEIKASCDFVILKAGGGDYSYHFIDPKFEEYYSRCKQYKIPVGAYYYCPKYMLTPDLGLYAAQTFLQLLKDKKFEMPVFLDIENTPKDKRAEATAAAISFCRFLEKNKYFVGIYSSDISGFKERLQVDKLSDFTLWVARYGRKPTYTRNYGLWQYSSSGEVPGIYGKVDMDISYKNYPKIIKGGKFNGYNT